MLFAIRFVDKPAAIEVRRRLLDEHIAWLKQHRSTILVAGSLRVNPEDHAIGGLWVVEAASKSAVEQLIATDPFWTHGLRERCEVLHWAKAFPEERASV